MSTYECINKTNITPKINMGVRKVYWYCADIINIYYTHADNYILDNIKTNILSRYKYSPTTAQYAYLDI